MKNFILVLTFFVFWIQLNAQTILTPNDKLNDKFSLGEIDAKDYFNISYEDGEFLIMPVIPENWTWFMVKDLPVEGKLLSFVFKDGRIFTTDNIRTNHRRIKYNQDITDKVEVDARLYAIYSDKGKEKHAAFFINSNEKNETHIKISKSVWGEEKIIPVATEPGELNYIVIQKLPKEATPLYFNELSGKRDTIDLNKNWKFSKDGNEQSMIRDFKDDEWENISIPHCWNAIDVFDTRNIKDDYYVNDRYYRGPAWYRKYFTLNKGNKEKIFLEFEAAFQKADVWINEQYLGKHLGGYTAFKFDITDIVEFGKDNILTVKVDNSYDYNLPPHSADYYMYGGIYRDVRLILTNEIHFTTEPKITTPKVSFTNADLEVNTQINITDVSTKEVHIVSNIVNSMGEIVSSVFQHIEQDTNPKEIALHHSGIKNPHLWSPDDQYLYKVVNTIYRDKKAIDEVVTPIGFRWYSFDADSVSP